MLPVVGSAPAGLRNISCSIGNKEGIALVSLVAAETAVTDFLDNVIWISPYPLWGICKWIRKDRSPPRSFEWGDGNSCTWQCLAIDCGCLPLHLGVFVVCCSLRLSFLWGSRRLVESPPLLTACVWVSAGFLGRTVKLNSWFTLAWSATSSKREIVMLNKEYLKRPCLCLVFIPVRMSRGLSLFSAWAQQFLGAFCVIACDAHDDS